MIRGGHIDVAVLGALEVSARGDIANWAVPGKDVLGVGGAMDLVVGARRVIVTMTATSSRGEPKVVRECTYPLTAAGAADVVVTELSVFRLVDGGLHLTELLGGRPWTTWRPSRRPRTSSRWRRAVSVGERGVRRGRDADRGGVDPPYHYHDYVGTRLRAPKEPLVIIPATLGD